MQGPTTTGRCAGECPFGGRPWHDDLLHLEGNAALLGRIVSDLIEGVRPEWEDERPPMTWDAVAAFVRYHGWDDQLGMMCLAELLTTLHGAGAMA